MTLDLQGMDAPNMNPPGRDRVEHASKPDRYLPDGVAIRSLTALNADSRRDEKLYRLVMQLRQDMPLPDRPSPMSLDAFRRHTLEDPALMPDVCLIALLDDDFVGCSWLLRTPDERTLCTGLTGVLAGYRRRGIARALKLRGFAYARDRGYNAINTYNASDNPAIVALNESLGFIRQPGWISFERSDDH